MLSLATASISNNEYQGGIDIEIIPTGASVTNVDNLCIMRKSTSNSTWVEIYAKEIAEPNDLNVYLFDIATVSGESYTYSIEMRSAYTPIESEMFYVMCQFDGLFVGNLDNQYFAQTNCETDAKLNTKVEYVETLRGRTPYRVSNADTFYYTGSSSGLFFEYTDVNGHFVPDYNHKYSAEVVEFLADGTDKVLKTTDGQIWYVSIDDAISLPFNDHYLGMNTVEFTWTEIGDMPLAWVVEK